VDVPTAHRLLITKLPLAGYFWLQASRHFKCSDDEAALPLIGSHFLLLIGSSISVGIQPRL
jgi:hypothetical protein